MMVRAVLALLAVMFGLPAAMGADRVAFIIGNSDYAHAQKLANPGADASAVASSLERLGFTVTLQRNLSKAAFELALADFSEQAADAEIALVYYAGHGMELAGQNYLVPVDARLKTDLRVKFETVSLDDVLASVEGARSLKLVLLDACRDNPFVASMTRRVATRSLGRGLAKVETEPGVLVSFAAAAGTVAEDGVGSHSPYTAALLTHLETPGLELSLLFRKVADDVQRQTKGRQTPFEYGRLPGTSIFLKPAPEPQQATVSEPDICRDAAPHWLAASKTGSVRLLEQHLDLFASCAFADLAKNAIDNLKASSNNTANAEQQRADTVGAGNVEHSFDVAALPLANNSELARDTRAEGVADKALTSVELARSAQEHLERLGCNPGKQDGLWGGRSRRAVEAFNRASGSALDVAQPSLASLEALAQHTTRVCPLVCAPTEVADGDRCIAKTCPEGRTLDDRGQCLIAKTRTTSDEQERRQRIQRKADQKPEKRVAKTRVAVPVDVRPVEKRSVQRAEPFTKKCVVMTFCDD